MDMPSADKYMEFASTMYSCKGEVKRAVKEYNIIMSSIEESKDVLALNNRNYKCLNTIKLFLMLSLKLEVQDFQNVKISKAHQVIKFFQLANDDFWDFYYHFDFSSHYKQLFLGVLIKLVIQLRLDNFGDVKI